ncbi:MAG TPA: AAA family ATPase [Candidatus Limnocylindrales bacterium]|nr:AAA family ATPase [Candidatus Limnocylindrales bacterium]
MAETGARCPNCKQPVPERARFCPACGATLAARIDAAERRPVTAIFADLAGSTALGDRLDPEVLRTYVSEFFEIAGREIRSHGGTVEQFSGDAAVGVFGLASAHEDDPERAVRTAFAIQQALTPLRALVAEQHHVTLDVHVGIESGEVVSGDPFAGGTSVTGDALNVAARLQKASAPGQILVGPGVYAATKHAVEYEPVGGLALAGKPTRVAAYQPRRLLAEVGEARGLRELKAPMLGRDEEMLQLLDTAERLHHDRKAMLFTVVGAPGIGKSRLAREASDRLKRRGWQVLRGRCLPYGEGITYWPVGEMVRQGAGITPEMGALEAVAQVHASSPDAGVSDRLAFAIGLTLSAPVTGSGVDREIAWAFRRWVQAQATRAPLLLVFEDIHWAEPAMLDLIDYLATWSGDAAVLVLCLSRPELLDTRPNWGGGRYQASRIVLEPLSRSESGVLIGALLTVEGLPDRLRAEMLERADGNPLFVEELIRMLLDEGTIVREGGRWIAAASVEHVHVPLTVEALIRARLDTLPRPQRTALQAGAVIGRTFERPLLDVLAEDREGLSAMLDDLVLRDLISEEPAPTVSSAGSQAYRFKHILVRDVAYATLPKARRATLHRLVAEALRAYGDDRAAELIEIRAYHLEEAVKLQTELHGEPSATLREEAAAALEASALRALARSDNRAALSFTERCLAIGGQPTEHRLEVECLLLDVRYRIGHYRLTEDLGKRIEIEARALGRKDLEGRAIIAQGHDIWIGGDEEGGATAALERFARAHALLKEAGDRPFVYEAAFQLGFGGWWFGRLEEAWRWWSEARAIAKELGDPGRESGACVYLAGVRYHQGHIAEAIDLRREAVRLAEAGGTRMDWGLAVSRYGWLVAMMQSFEEGLRLVDAAVPVLDEAGSLWELARTIDLAGRIRVWMGQPALAIPCYERALALSDQMKETGYRPEIERNLAYARLAVGDLSGAATHAEAGVKVVGADDWASVASTAMVMGQVRAAQGRAQEAEALLRRAIDVFERTDYRTERWEIYLALAEFLVAQGRAGEAPEWISRTRAIMALFGEQSPIAQYVERRLRAPRKQVVTP